MRDSTEYIEFITSGRIEIENAVIKVYIALQKTKKRNFRLFIINNMYIFSLLSLMVYLNKNILIFMFACNNQQIIKTFYV